MVKNPIQLRTLVACSALALLTVDIAYAQNSTVPEKKRETVNLGARGLSAARAERFKSAAESGLEFSAQAGAATDYIYRGVTLSDRDPAFGAGFEAAYGNFYAAATVATVKLPSDPDAEISLAAGIRPSLGKFDFDLGVMYFLYPGEITGSKIEYWEATARVDTSITESFRVAGGFAYSPNVSNTGAWSWYAAGGFEYDLPVNLPTDFGLTFSAAAGYSWFGAMSAAMGGFPLPDYVNWHAGLTFSYKNSSLDLRYYDTNLSQENCYVFTGDPGATPGGTPNPVTNPGGLKSRWCGATFVAKVVFALN